MASTYIQAVLATLLALLPLWDGYLARRSVVPWSKRRRLFDAANASMGLFFDTCLFVNIIVSMVVIVLISRLNLGGGVAQVALAHDIGFFTWLATVLPALVDEETEKRNARHGAVFFISTLLSIVMGSMIGPTLSFNYASGWEAYCCWDIIPRERRVTLHLLRDISLPIVALALVGALGHLLVAKCWPAAATRSLRRHRRSAIFVLTLATGLHMWFILINVTVLRQLLFVRSGFKSDDLEWSFGQILALGSWLPMAVEVTSLLCKGIDGTIKDRVPHGWAVVKVDTPGATT